MDVKTCVDCGKYRYIESNGLCRECYDEGECSQYEYTYPDIDNRFSSRTGMNQFVLGMIGSGKTVGNKIEIQDVHDYKNTNVYIVDPIGSYDSFVNSVGGKSVKIGTKDYFNFMKIKKSSVNSGSLAERIDTLTDLVLRSYDVTGVSITDPEKQLLFESIRRTYNKHGITDDVKTHSLSSPNIGHLMNTIKSLHRKPRTIVNSSGPVTNKKKARSTLMSLYTDIEKITKKLNVGNTIDKDFSNNDLVYFDVSKSAPGLRGLKMQMVLNEVWQYSSASQENDLLYIDNAKYLLSGSDQSISSLEKMFAHSRHYDLGISVSMIPDRNILNSAPMKGIVMNCDYLRLHRLRSNANVTTSILNLSQNQLSYLKNANVGAKSNNAEVLFSDPNGGYSSEKIKTSDEFLSRIH